MQSYRLKCRQQKCQAEFVRGFKPEEFDAQQYNAEGTGITCFRCGYPRMIVMKSAKMIKDSFEPGFQRNIRKHCSTYGEYKRHLKEMGLIELGYEDLPESEGPVTNYFPDDVMKDLYAKHGVSLDSRAIAHLRGEI